MAKKASKSKAQEALATQLSEIYPFATVLQEVYIGKVIESQGFSVEEISKELGRKPHKMFVDIMIQDSEMTVACEYNGEQHYHQVGNMTATSADVLLNQQLDEEKAWILQRIGIPIVTVAYDTYIDESVFDTMVSEAYEEMEDFLSSYYICDECERRFPKSQIKMGICPTCRKNHIQEVEEYSQQAKKQNQKRFNSSGDDEWKKQQKELAKQKRKEEYRKWKESPEYLAQKERQKLERKKRNAELKEKRREERRKMKEAQRQRREG